jgi:hypothetical protein
MSTFGNSETDPILDILVAGRADAETSRRACFEAFADAGVKKWVEGMSRQSVINMSALPKENIGETFLTHFESDPLVELASDASYSDGFLDGWTEALERITAYMKGLS